MWSQRDLTYTGRQLVINSLASAGSWYYSNLIHIPDHICHDIESAMYDFFGVKSAI